MREENIISLKELFVDEVRKSLSEFLPKDLTFNDFINKLDESNFKKQIESSFKDIISILDDEVLNITSFVEEINNEDDFDDLEEYWGE